MSIIDKIRKFKQVWNTAERKVLAEDERIAAAVAKRERKRQRVLQQQASAQHTQARAA
jgi:hypothetical protein